MTKKALTINIVNTTSNQPEQHLQLSGQAHFDGERFSFFVPDNTVPALVPGFVCRGQLQQMRNGTIDFVRKPWAKSGSKLLRKVAHGRLSQTKADTYRLTLEIGRNEGIKIAEAFIREATEAVEALSYN